MCRAEPRDVCDKNCLFLSNNKIITKQSRLNAKIKYVEKTFEFPKIEEEKKNEHNKKAKIPSSMENPSIKYCNQNYINKIIRRNICLCRTKNGVCLIRTVKRAGSPIRIGFACHTCTTHVFCIQRTEGERENYHICMLNYCLY